MRWAVWTVHNVEFKAASIGWYFCRYNLLICVKIYILLHFVWHKWEFIYSTIYIKYFCIQYMCWCMCVTLLGILYKWVGWLAVLINLLLLKQSKCKLDLSICVSQTIMRREFKWPGCFSSILTQSWNLQRDNFCVNKKKLCIRESRNSHRLYWRLAQYKVLSGWWCIVSIWQLSE